MRTAALDIGQKWAVRDDRYEGWRYVTITDLNERYVYVQGPRRKSRVLRDRFRGSRYTYCGYNGPGTLPVYSSTPVALGCLSCPPVSAALPMKYQLDPGFGRVCVTRDSEVVYTAHESSLILAHFERRARAEPGDWRLEINTPMRDRLYQRQGPSTWVLVAIGMGFA